MQYALQKSRPLWLLEEWSEFAVTVQLYSAVGIWSYCKFLLACKVHANAGYCQYLAFGQHNRQDICQCNACYALTPLEAVVLFSVILTYSMIGIFEHCGCLGPLQTGKR
ncbi:hypothetical protein PISMIDRAFT_683724 [Pisolithus microcarpus 441]|uniref:Uncharacterized protein n=1 Tax=Pisolithus microcarpus 441 TaxID=765257 RepID=A0A0C9Z8Y3_9AGAM|nr:hypothetical protein PISMIDRAFT_683724 [Pisolithus microcarpus 441]